MGRPKTDPTKRFEETKQRNFRASSKLDGIDVPEVTASLEEVLKKHRQPK